MRAVPPSAERPEPPPEPETCPAPDGAQTGKPIIPATGEKVYAEPDYVGTGPHPLSLTRSFRSRWSTGVALAAPDWARRGRTTM